MEEEHGLWGPTCWRDLAQLFLLHQTLRRLLQGLRVANPIPEHRHWQSGLARASAKDKNSPPHPRPHTKGLDEANGQNVPKLCFCRDKKTPAEKKATEGQKSQNRIC